MIAFFVGAIAGGIIGLGMMAFRRQYRQNVQHMQVILMDLFTAGSLSKVSAKAKERRPRWHRLPYGVPLCIGFVGYLWVAHPFEKPANVEEPPAQSSMQLAKPMSLLAAARSRGVLHLTFDGRNDGVPFCRSHKTQS